LGTFAVRREHKEVKERKLQKGSHDKWKELRRALSGRTTMSTRDLHELVQKHVAVQTIYAIRKLTQDGTLEKIALGRRGLYAVRGNGSKAGFLRDPLEVIRSTYGEEMYYCYGTALFLLGLSRYGRISSYCLGSNIARNQRTFGQFAVRVIKTPVGKGLGVKRHKIGDHTVSITDTERTILDCLHKPKYAEGWENVLHALTKIKRIDEMRILNYAKQYRIPSLAGKLGVVLEHFKEEWAVTESMLDRLQQYCTHQPVQFLPGHRGKLNKRWHLYVPDGLFDGDLHFTLIRKRSDDIEELFRRNRNLPFFTGYYRHPRADPDIQICCRQFYFLTGGL